MGAEESKPAVRNSSLKKIDTKRRDETNSFKRILDSFETYEDVQLGLQKAGLESSQLIVGIDFTKSNEWTGRASFGGHCLHNISNDFMNPYEETLTYISKTLKKFDDDNLIPCYGFGDITTHDYGVFSFFDNNQPAQGLELAVMRYRQLAPYVQMSGPTSFAPIIYQAMRIVIKNNFQFHILLLIADGMVTPNCTDQTMKAIEAASKLPLSIVMVGVGDGPWDKMQQFDDEIPTRTFDNFQFVNFNKIMEQASVYRNNLEKRGAHFAVHALMEIPQQYKIVQKLGLMLSENNPYIIDETKQLLYPVPPSVKAADSMYAQQSIGQPSVPTTEYF